MSSERPCPANKVDNVQGDDHQLGFPLPRFSLKGEGRRAWFPQDVHLSAVHNTSTWGVRGARARKKGRGPPQQPAVLRCPEHGRPACILGRERRRGVRNCCTREHHKADYPHRPQSRGLRQQHKVGVCTQSQHEARPVLQWARPSARGQAKAWPKPGRKPAAPADGQQARSGERWHSQWSNPPPPHTLR